jgi:hypothetical protein
MTNYSGTKCPKCPKCESTSFEEVIESPLKSLIMINFIRCTSCKTAIGIRECESSAKLTKELAKRLNIIL